MGAAASRQEPRHRSLHSRVPTRAVFENCTRHRVRVLWLGYDGKPRVYVVLRPGATHRQASYCCHPWCFEPEEGDATLVCEDQQVVYLQEEEGEQRVRITEAATVAWSPETQRHFPQPFQEQARALLFCHHRGSQPCRGGRAGVMGAPGRSLSHCRAGGAALLRLACGYLLGSPAGLAGKLPNRLHCSAGCRPEQPPAAVVEEPAEHAAAASCALGRLPKELVLEVLRRAAPHVQRLAKPSFPPGAEDSDVPAADRKVLFSD